MAIRIKEVKSKKDFKNFIDLPDKIYKGDKNWVPKLNIDIKHLLSDDNPFYSHAFKKLFLAYDGGEVVGRIAAIIDFNFIKFQNERTGFFGFFECSDNIDIARELLKKCEETLITKDMKKIIGPANPSTNDEWGLLIDGFDSPPRLMMPYNPSYYTRLIDEAGYGKVKDLLALNMNFSDVPDTRLKRMVEKIKKRYPKMYSRSVNLKDFKNEMDKVREIYNDAWQKNWGFVPWTEDEINDIAKQLKPLVIPDLVQIGFWDDEPIGLLVALPDYNEVIKKIGRYLFPLGWLKFIFLKGKIKNIRTAIMGIKKEYQNKGISALMYYNAYLASMKRGFKECEFSWILEDNYDTLRIGRMLGGSVYKRYRVYEKNLK